MSELLVRFTFDQFSLTSSCKSWGTSTNCHLCDAHDDIDIINAVLPFPHFLSI